MYIYDTAWHGVWCAPLSLECPVGYVLPLFFLFRETHLLFVAESKLDA